MQEKLYHIWTVLRRQLDKVAIGVGLALLGLVIGLRILESGPPAGIPNPTQPFKLKPYFPTRYIHGSDPYNRAANFLELKPDIEQVEDGRYTILLKFNPFDKKHAVPESEVAKQLTEMYNQALAAFRSGNYRRTIELCDQVIEQDPSRYGAVQLLNRAKEALQNKP